MSRVPIFCLMTLFAASCAVMPEPGVATTLAAETPFSEELECLGDCFGEGDSSGDSCVERCL
jgi:hypothetical protein